MPLTESLERMRRFLRDIDGAIWTDDDLMAYWNIIQLEFAQKTGLLEKVEAQYYPPVYTWSYMWDWEYARTDGDRLQVLNLVQQTGDIVTTLWESAYYLTTSSTPEDGSHFTHPWESEYCTPATVVPVLLHSRFESMKFCAWDEEQIDPELERNIAAVDPWYRTTSGSPVNYYRPDDFSNHIVIYPRPSAVTWQETTIDEVMDDLGGLISSSEAYLDDTNTGITTDVIDSENALFLVYDAIPFDIDNWSDSPVDWPDWLMRYIEYGVLEMAYGADTDGYIPSLRDYWRNRKDIGFKILERWKRMKLADRDFRLGGFQRTSRPGRGRLPAGYPAI